ncbi:MAG: helix-turn-helix transcriptional regulator, partial [Myxococcota bacterium]
RRSQPDVRLLLAHFDALSVPIVVVDERGHAANAAVDDLGLPSRERDRLLAACRRVGRALLAAGSLAGMAHAFRFWAGPMELHVSARVVERDRPLALVQVDRTRELPPYAAVKAAFGLTPTEYAVAELVVRRLSDKEVAARIGVSYHTARQHVAKVLRKVSVSRDRLAAILWQAFLAQD